MGRLLCRFIVALVVCMGASPAAAHPLLQDAMWVLVEPGRIRLALNVSAREIAVAQRLEAGATASDTVPPGLADGARRHGDYVLKHLRVSADGHELAGRIAGITPPPGVTSGEKTFYQYEIDYPLTAFPSRITLFHDMLREIPYAAGTPWDVTYVVRVKRFDSSEVSTGLLRFQQPCEFPTGSAAKPDDSRANAPREDERTTFRAYLFHGARHILTGYDHLLFVSALVLAALSFWEMVKVIAAFTLAHTVTLALSVFGVFRLPPPVVEPVIALSIVFVALENVLWPRRARSWIRLAGAFGFGLVHGLGFAGGLLDAMAGLPVAGIWVALAAFSVGVEAGHLAVVLPLFGLLSASRRLLHARISTPAVRCASLLISVCGIYYLCVALHAQFLRR